MSNELAAPSIPVKLESKSIILQFMKVVLDNWVKAVVVFSSMGTFCATWVIWYVLHSHKANDLFIPALTENALVIPAIIFCGIIYLIGLSILLLSPIFLFFAACDTEWSKAYDTKWLKKILDKIGWLKIILDKIPVIIVCGGLVFFLFVTSHYAWIGQFEKSIAVLVYAFMFVCVGLIRNDFLLGATIFVFLYFLFLFVSAGAHAEKVAKFAGITQTQDNLRYYQLDKKYEQAVENWPVHLVLNKMPVIQAYKGFQLTDIVVLCYQDAPKEVVEPVVADTEKNGSTCLRVGENEIVTMPTRWKPSNNAETKTKYK